MGLIDKVNVEVNGSGDLLSTLSTYTTKILKPNIVDGKNILTQAMISSKNTIYVIKYDFVLGENITVPANCVLEFDGGSIGGAYTITGQNTKVIATQDAKIFHTINIAGNWDVPTIYVDWFDVSETVGYDNTPIIINAFNLANDNIQNIIVFPTKILYISEHITYSPEMLYLFNIPANTKVVLNSDLILNTCNKPHYQIFTISNKDNICITGCGSITGDVDTHIHDVTVHNGEEGAWGHGIVVQGGKNISINNIKISKCWGDGIVLGYFTVETSNIIVKNITLDTNRRQGITVDCVNNLEIAFCNIINTGTTRGTAPRSGIDFETYYPNKAEGSELLIFKNHYVHNNYFYNNAGHDILIAGDGTSPQMRFDNITICNNLYEESSNIQIYGCNNVIIKDEKFPILFLGVRGNNDTGLANTVGTNNVTISNCIINRINVNDDRIEKITNINFDKCKFIYNSGIGEIINNNNSWQNTWQANFTDCLFDINYTNTSSTLIVSKAKYNAIERFYRCSFTSEGFIGFYGVACFDSCKFEAYKMSLNIYITNIKASIVNNIFNTVSGTPFRIYGNPDVTTEVGSYINVFNNINISNTAQGIISIHDNNRTYFAKTAFNIFNNIAKKGLFKAIDVGPSDITINLYNNKQLSGKSTSPNTGEEYFNGTKPEWYNGSDWVDATGQTV